MAQMVHSMAIYILLIIFLTTMSSQFQSTLSSSKPTGFSLKLIPADSPKSPLYPGNLTKQERMQWLINITQARAQYLQHRSRRSNSSTAANSSSTLVADPENIRCSMIRDVFYFAAHVSIGNPIWEGHLLMDTGGGLVWTQCEPCIECFHVTAPNYDPRVSNTYVKLSCDHPLCESGFYSCVNGQCVYDVTYGGGDDETLGRTRGVASMERFTFDTTEGGPAAIDAVIFGCSDNNTNFDNFGNGDIAGIMGLSLSPDSLLMQLNDRVLRKYSYCMPSMHGGTQGDVVLSFGMDIPIPLNLQSTPIVTPPGSHYFYLNLVDISVGSEKLQLPPGIFRANTQGTEGFFIDSGAPVTVLDENAYGVNVYHDVIQTFKFYYNSLGLERSEDSPYEFDLCYELPEDFQEHEYLGMTYHFYPKADYVVRPIDVHYVAYDTFCVAILPSGGPSILGAWHQQNMQIIYDLNINALHFATQTCT